MEFLRRTLHTLYPHLPEFLRLRIFEGSLWMDFIVSYLKAKRDQGSSTTPTTRYIISKRFTGLGDCIISLISAWQYAKKTGRTLVIDWRFSCYIKDPYTNLFPLLFQPPAHIDGVPVMYDQSINHQTFPGTFFPPEWSANLIHHPRPDNNQFLTKTMAKQLKSQRDVPASSIVIHGCMSDARPTEEECRLFLSHLVPVTEVSRPVQEFHNAYFQSHPVIGVHIRHGNGGDILDHQRYWADGQLALNHCTQQIRAALDTLGGKTVIFLCTDSLEVKSFMKAQFPNVLIRKKIFRPTGEGELHQDHPGLQTAQEALIEMLLLSYSTTLIQYPPESFFSFYAKLFHQYPKPHLAINA